MSQCPSLLVADFISHVLLLARRCSTNLTYRKILKRIRHPNVIQLFGMSCALFASFGPHVYHATYLPLLPEVIDAPRQIFLVMEYLDGGELFDYIVRHQRIREDVAVRFFHDIVDGLSYLHRKEVAHRYEHIHQLDFIACINALPPLSSFFSCCCCFLVSNSDLKPVSTPILIFIMRSD